MMDDSAFCRLQEIRARHRSDFALYWAITVAISQIIGADVEYPIRQMEYWLDQRTKHVADQEAA